MQDEICEYLNSFADEDEFGTVLKAHDNIIESIEYKYDEHGNPSNDASAHNIVGVIEESGAVCEGYSKAFQLICDCYGVDSLTVSGDSRGQDHMWNVVKLDEKWYWVDVTWDDIALDSLIPTSKSYATYIGKDTIYDRHRFFLTNDTNFLSQHTIYPALFSFDKPYTRRATRSSRRSSRACRRPTTR